MSNPIVIIKNNTLSPITIQDLSGVTVDSTSQLTLTDIFYFYDIAKSINLKTYVSNGNIIINNGTSDLSVSNGLDHITIKSSYDVSQEITTSAEQYHYFGSTAPDSTSVIWIDSQHYYPRLFDCTRNKWLSFNRSTYSFSYNGAISNGYLNVGHVRTSESGYVIPHIGCITEICVLVTNSSENAEFSLRHCSEPFYYFNLDGTNLLYRDVDVNIDIDEGCILQCFIEDNVQNPIVSITVTWRHE